MRLAEPTWLCLLIVAFWPLLGLKRRLKIAWPTLSGFAGRRAWPAWVLRVFPVILRVGAVGCLAVAMARPQVVGGQIRVAGRGVAIVAVLDRSSSMKTVDFPTSQATISRLEAAKVTLSRFIQGRSDDLVGLVAFANYLDPVVAPTLDQGFLLDATSSVKPAGTRDDGTNIGDAIAWSLGMVRDLPTRRKVVVLLTDGRNAPAVPKPVDPIEAAALARALGVTLHTIAIGRPVDPAAPSPDKDKNDGPDLVFLQRLAEVGGGKAFVAADADALEQVFDEIDELEKSPVSGTIRTIYRELFAPWVVAALILLTGHLLLSTGRFRRLP